MTSPRPRTLRAAALVAGAAAVGLVLAGCSATNPITTQAKYSASDGVRVTLGDVVGSNLLVLSAAEGDPGAMQGGLINDGSEDRLVTVAIGDDETIVTVGAKETVLLGVGRNPEDGFAEVTFPVLEAAPGSTVSVTLSTPQDGSISVEVPVLDGTLPEYATAVPSPTS
ncbi:hypothetical protein [Cellulomonas fengjieae]|uniref:Lipoprotein LpqE n=1 Tax=Cellulomonas fengjieae TaxID=2819978 RepID=A0ABS3SGY9_9CELL|nr:hypothetical protein [Cellulomonas fengjieae]MBO3085016.1 hypothetical protein [Cellulomonas fengjieae]MBO3100763.1 hypothetical protein [Cellulomonas fengjieae]QVI66387.1 hypothetical protein KG102_01905 [Cellulomonas fengjieae]